MLKEDGAKIAYLSSVDFQRSEGLTPIRFHLRNGLVAGDGLHAGSHHRGVDYFLNKRCFALGLGG